MQLSIYAVPNGAIRDPAHGSMRWPLGTVAEPPVLHRDGGPGVRAALEVPAPGGEHERYDVVFDAGGEVELVLEFEGGRKALRDRLVRRDDDVGAARADGVAHVPLAGKIREYVGAVALRRRQLAAVAAEGVELQRVS